MSDLDQPTGLNIRPPQDGETLAAWVTAMAAQAVGANLAPDAVAAVGNWAIEAGTKRGLGAFLERAAEDSDLLDLLDVGGPAAIAGLVVKVSKAGHDYVNGTMSQADFEQECIEAGIRSAMVWACGAIGQAVLPVPVAGGLVGAVMGYAASAATVEGLRIVRAVTLEAQVSEERLAYVRSLTEQAKRDLRSYRLQVEAVIAHEAEQFADVLLPIMDDLDSQLEAGDDLEAVATMSRLAHALELELEWSTFPEFDDFMHDEDRVLEL